MDSFRITQSSDGVATVWFDTAGKSVNTLGPHTLAELGQVIDELERTKPAGVIFASAKPRNFIAGADLFEIRAMDQSAIEEFLHEGQTAFDRIEHLSMPTVAAINGDCLGGGLELALACKYRIAADDSSIKIGLPEVKLGIIPGFGGTVRMTRLLGLPAALPLLIAGKTMPPKKAKKAGIIDEVDRPEALMDAAARWAGGKMPEHAPKWSQKMAGSVGLMRGKILAKARAEIMRRTHGDYPAALKVIDVAGIGIEGGGAAGLAAERRGLLDLMKTPACENLMRLFFLQTGAKKAASAKNSAKPNPVEYAAVIGGGTMGAGIVHAMIRAGIKVRLIEMNDQAAAAALGRIRASLDQDVRDGRMDALAAKHAFNRVVPTTQWDGLGICDFAIEAVLEKMDVKRDVFARLDKLLPAHAIIASNTSSLSITEMSHATTNPARVVGMHFFNPVAKMPLVEIVRTENTDSQTLATTIALAGKLGKTPVVVRDAPGFLVNRVLIPYLAEAALMAREGHGIREIDDAMRHFGWPMGPFELLDEIGLDVGSEVLKQLAAKDEKYSEVPQWVGKLIERGSLGKKSGKGFYLHDKNAKRDAELVLNPELQTIWQPAVPTVAFNESEIQRRLMAPMIHESQRVLDEGIVDNTDAIDLATVMGLGFPPFRGGLARYAKTTTEPVAETPAPIITTPAELHATHA
jgi:3-hydroxyacyl-CoA dehydrogenase/enoyl-CoA hydratase/3-hydroxybutyryl-CoA epimerase